MKHDSFDYQYFFAVTPFLEPNAFGFWRIWWAEAIIGGYKINETTHNL